MSSPKIYTRTGDDGTTGLLFGGRVQKNSALPMAYGSVDEAQAFLGVARANVLGAGLSSEMASEVDALLVEVETDLYVLMGELATSPENRHKLTSLVSVEMVTRLEDHIDDLKSRFEAPANFVVPGGDRLSAALDVARTVVRRCERDCAGPEVAAGTNDGSHAMAYLNRLSDLAWTMARWVEGETMLAAEAGEATSP